MQEQIDKNINKVCIFKTKMFKVFRLELELFELFQNRVLSYRFLYFA
jgi:hypothetical protein